MAGLIGLAAALSAPVAMSRIPEPGPGSPSGLPTSEANSIYANGCKDGTITGTTGGDNNNYDYYGNPCDPSATAPSGLPVTAPSGNPTAAGTGHSASSVFANGCKNGTVPGTSGGDNNNYDYYSNPCDF